MNVFTSLRSGIRLAMSVAMVLVGAAIFTGAASAAPYEPTDETLVLERLPAAGNTVDSELRRLRKALSDDPRDLDLALGLARRYLDLGRSEADPRYNGYAEAALRPWSDSPHPPTQVLVLRAVLLQNRHAFDAALTVLEQVLASQPDHAQAWLSRSFILQVQGKHGAARESCVQLPPSLDPLIPATCLSRVDALNGQAGRALRRLTSVVRRAGQSEGRLKLWALTNLAEIALSTGLEDQAETHFQAAMNLGRRDAYLLGAYADFLLSRGRAEEARSLLRDETRADGLLLRLALAEQSLGRPEATAHIRTLEARFADSRLRGDMRHLREEARFALHLVHDAKRALRLARDNWLVQREPWDARLLLESALAANSPESAEPVLAWLAETGFEGVTVRRLAKRLREGES